MKVVVFGTGYVGLVQAAALADVGHQVVGVDIDVKRVERLSQGEVPIFEPGLETMIRDSLETGRIRFTTDAATAIQDATIAFIAVGTPSNEDGSADLRQVLIVADTIAAHLTKPLTVAVKSTVPVGSGDQIEAAVAAAQARRGTSIDVAIVSNPEFLKEGSAIADCLRPDRIILGTANPTALVQLRELYAPFNRNHEKIIVMDRRSAELAKYAANAMLATKISLMNELANLAEYLGADIEMVRKAIGADPRIGYHFIYAGAGFGGSCFPKDVRALVRTADELGFDAAVLRAVQSRNERQKNRIFEKLDSHFAGRLAGRTIAVWGLAFKPNTDDMREAPSRTLLEALWDRGAKVRATDPQAIAECRRLYGDRPDLVLLDDPYAATDGADALAVVTDWKAFQAPDFTRLKAQLHQRLIVDGRNLFDPATVERYGLAYYGVGRGR